MREFKQDRLLQDVEADVVSVEVEDSPRPDELKSCNIQLQLFEGPPIPPQHEQDELEEDIILFIFEQD